MVRPDVRRYLRTVRRPIPLLLLLLFVVLLGVFVSEHPRSPGPLLTAALGYGIIAYTVLWQLLYLRNARVVATPEQLEWRGAFGGVHRVVRDQVGAVVERRVMYRRYPRRRIMVLDTRGAVLIELSPLLWNAGELRSAWRIFGVEPDVDDSVTSPAELRRQYPNTTSWLIAHSDLVGWLLVGGLLLVTVVLSLLSGASPF